jgi:hypothetical protein
VDRPGSTADLAPWHEGEQLASVVLYSLISAAPTALSLEQIAHACQRNQYSEHDRDLISLALRILLEDGLVYRRDMGFGATRAAVRAEELRF